MKRNTIFLPKTVINGHGHARDFEDAHKMTIKQYLMESLAALIHISILMPNTGPITTLEMLEKIIAKVEKAKKALSIKEDQYVYFGITDSNLGDCEEALKHPLVVGLKDYPLGKDKKTVTTGTIGVMHRETREKGVQLTKKASKVYARHCANPEVFVRTGKDTIKGEEYDVKDMIEIAKMQPEAKILICHVSNERCAKAILQAQKEGLLIAIEICIHYLWFDSNHTNWNPLLDPVFYHCYNSLRKSNNRKYLIEKLITKVNPLVFIASDSAPHLEEEKMANKKLGGIPTHLEMVPVMITLAKENGISEQQTANLISFNPAKFFGIPISKELVEYEIEEKVDNLQYNNGKILNPWNGSKLWFPVREVNK
ncbi:hypothetical protein ACFLY1_00910 [Patescibacteria group bacterium]